MEKEIRKRITSLRKEKGLTKNQLAKALCVSTNTISNWENAKTKIGAEKLIRLANFFDVSIDYLLGLKDKKK